MPRILIVDSNLPFLMRLRKSLEKQGLDVRAISRPRPALKELSQQRFDVAVVDLHMDWVDMPTFIKDLRIRQPDLPIVLTGQYEEDPEQVGVLEAQGYLNKPYLARDMLPIVEKAIARGYTPSTTMEDQIFAGEFGEVPSFDALLEMALVQSQRGDEPEIEDDATLGQLLSTLYDEDVEADILQRVSEKRGERVDADVMPALLIPDDEMGRNYTSIEPHDADVSQIVQEQKWREALAKETDNLPATSALKLANSAQAMHRFLQRVEEAQKHTGRDVEVKPLPSWSRPFDKDEEEYQRALLEAVHLGDPPTSLPETFEAPPHAAQTQPITVPEIDLYLDPNTPAQPSPAVNVAQIVDTLDRAQDMANVPVPQINEKFTERAKRDRSKMLPRADELPEEPYRIFEEPKSQSQDTPEFIPEPQAQSQDTPAYTPEPSFVDAVDEPEIVAQDTPAFAAESESVGLNDTDELLWSEPEVGAQATPEFIPEPQAQSQDTPAYTLESAIEAELESEPEYEYFHEPNISEILAEEESLIPVSVDEITRSMGIDVNAEYAAIFGIEEEMAEEPEPEDYFEPEPIPQPHAYAPEVTQIDEEAVDELLSGMEDLDVVGHATLQLMEMSLESTATAIMLFHDMRLIARSGELSEQTWRELEEVFNKAWERPGLGNTRLAYEDVYGMGDILLYSQLSVNNLILSLVFPNNMPVSQIRKQATRLRGALETLPEAEAEPIHEPTQIIAVDEDVETTLATEPETSEEAPAAVTQPSRPTGMRPPDGLRTPKPNPIPERDKGAYMSYGVLWLLDAADVNFNKPIANALSAWIYRLAADNDWDVHALEIGKGWINMHIEIPSQELVGKVLEAFMEDTNARLLNALGRDPDFDESLWIEGYSINTPGRLFTHGEIDFFMEYYERELAP